MPYYIEIECNACHSKFKIDAGNYANKKISFICKNCGDKISYFVPPGIQGLTAPKADISTKKIKKVREENKKERNEDPLPVESASSMTTDKLKLKLPSLFKRKHELDKQEQKPAEIPDIGHVINPPVLKIPPVQQKQYLQTERNTIPESGVRSVGKGTMPFPVAEPFKEENIIAKNSIKKTNDFLAPDAGKDLASVAEPVDFHPIIPKNYTGAPAVKPDFINTGEKSLVHVPKPGMPFIAQLSTPSFYKAGSARRKDYSFVVTEISRFRNAWGRTVMPDPPSTNKMADVSMNGQDFTAPEFTSVSEPVPAIPIVIERQPELPDPPTPSFVHAQPTSAEIEEEAIEFEKNIQDEIKHKLALGVKEEDRKMEFAVPIPLPAKDSKIFIPLDLKINSVPERSSSITGGGDAAAITNNMDNKKIITPDIEIIEDSYTSGVPPASGQPGFQIKIPQIPTPFASYEQRPLTDNRTLQPNGVGVAPQIYPVGDQQGFSAPAAIPSYPPLQQPYQQTPPVPPFMGQELDVVQQPQVPFYNLKPEVPQQPPSVSYQTEDESPALPFLKENAPYKSAETLYQPQPYEQPERLESVGVSPYMQHQTATQRIPRYQQGNVQQDGKNSYPPMNGNIMPAQTSGQSYPLQPDFQGFGTPRTNQQAVIQQSKPMPVVPSAPIQQPQGPFAQVPPAPVPPPSVTSPSPTGTQKKPAIIDEDEEERFGPSNFGLDF